MNYLQFYHQWERQGCFSINEIMAWCPDFDRSNLTRWVANKQLLRLRQGWYAVPEVLGRTDFARVVAERIYRPSYLSLHTALSIYGMIPEAVVQYTCVTTLKTARFDNALGQYAYYNVKPELMFGYKPVSTPDGRCYLLAFPEKALLDLLYLNPFYNTKNELEQLRLDDAFMADELDRHRLADYQQRIGSKALNQRVKMLLELYPL